MRIPPCLEHQDTSFTARSLICNKTAGQECKLTESVPHRQLCVWGAGRHSWLYWHWLHAPGAAWRSPGFQIQQHHTGLCLHWWPGHSHPHLVECRESTGSDECVIKPCKLSAVWHFTLLYEYLQSLSVAVFSCDPQRCHSMNISRIWFSSMSKQ